MAFSVKSFVLHSGDRFSFLKNVSRSSPTFSSTSKRTVLRRPFASLGTSAPASTGTRAKGRWVFGALRRRWDSRGPESLESDDCHRFLKAPILTRQAILSSDPFEEIECVFSNKMLSTDFREVDCGFDLLVYCR